MKLDLLLMKCRQRQWQQASPRLGASPNPLPFGFFIMLSSDSSPQSGLEYYACLEDRVPIESAARVVGVTVSELRQWSLSASSVRTACLPLTVLGSGRQTVAAKYECLAHAALLDTAFDANVAHTASYSQHVVGFCSDYGAEGQLVEVPPIRLAALQERNFKASKGLLIPAGPLAAAPSRCLSQLMDDGEGGGGGGEGPVAFQQSSNEHTFSLQGSLMIPGIKHLLNNIEGDVLDRLKCYPAFEA